MSKIQEDFMPIEIIFKYAIVFILTKFLFGCMTMYEEPPLEYPSANIILEYDYKKYKAAVYVGKVTDKFTCQNQATAELRLMDYLPTKKRFRIPAEETVRLNTSISLLFPIISYHCRSIIGFRPKANEKYKLSVRSEHYGTGFSCLVDLFEEVEGTFIKLKPNEEIFCQE